MEGDREGERGGEGGEGGGWREGERGRERGERGEWRERREGTGSQKEVKLSILSTCINMCMNTANLLHLPV